MSRLTRDGTAEPASRDQILRRERGQGNIHFFCSADHVQDWQPYPVDPYSCDVCDGMTIHTMVRDPAEAFRSLGLKMLLSPRRLTMFQCELLSIRDTSPLPPDGGVF